MKILGEEVAEVQWDELTEWEKEIVEEWYVSLHELLPPHLRSMEAYTQHKDLPQEVVDYCVAQDELEGKVGSIPKWELNHWASKYKFYDARLKEVKQMEDSFVAEMSGESNA